MRIVIAGGTGLIGRALTWHFVAAGDEVTVLTRGGASRDQVVAGAHSRLWDGATQGEWTRCIDGCDVVVNLAGAPVAAQRWTAKRKRELLHSRTDPGRALIRAMEVAEVRPALLIQASGVGYYGTSDDATFDETSPPGRDFLARLAEEWEASTADVPPGMRRIVARFGAVLATRGGAFPKLALPFRFYAGGPIGTGRQWFPWIHLDDVVSALEHLAFDTEVAGPANLVAPEPTRNTDVATALATALRRPNYVRTPRLALTLALGEMATLLTEGQRVRPRVLEESGFIFNFPGIELAALDLLSAGPSS